MSFEEACRALGISEGELEALVAAGEIASIKEGDTLFFKPDVVQRFKDAGEDDGTILLSDEEIPLLEDDDVEEIDLLAFDDEETSPTEPAPVAAAEPEAATPEIASVEDISLGGGDAEEISLDDVEEISLEDDDDDVIKIDLEDDDELPEIDLGLGDELELEPETSDLGAGRPDETADLVSLSGDAEETLLNMDGLLEEESESTTPIAAGLDDDLLGGDLGDDTLLDTELDFGEETDTFEVDTVDDLAADLTEEATLLRGGGARVMQMKKKESNVAMSIVLALSALILLAPIAVLANTIYLRYVPPSGDTAAAIPPADNHKWVVEYNPLGGAIEGIADSLKSR